MPYCPECGAENDPEAKFCKKCGLALKEERRPRSRREKEEKHEKQEKEEKHEKEEKYEKREASALGQLVGGLILVLIGVAFYLTVNNIIPAREVWPYFVIIVGLIVIVLAVYGGRTAFRRHPRP